MGPARKRVKTTAVAEVVFDPAARQDYLTGFHKRKLARIKHAQELAAKKEREEKIAERAKLRQQRKDDLEKHVEEVNAAVKRANQQFGVEVSSDEEDGTDDEWAGFEDQEVVNHEEEYIDEDKYTTVTVAEVDITKDGMMEPEDESSKDSASNTQNEHEETSQPESGSTTPGGKRLWTKKKPDGDKPKKKKRQFRYESKAERKVTRQKEKSKGRSQAKARRS